MKITLAETEAARQACFDVRDAVFTVEQGITDVPDIDEYDADALQYLAEDETGPAGTARIVAKADTAKIGRVAVLKSHRGTGLGGQIMQTVMDDAKARGFRFAILESQARATAFYGNLGFVAEGPEYDDGSGILHIMMRTEL